MAQIKYYYHGTSADNLPSILLNGLSGSEEKLWICSGEEIYLWCPESLAATNMQEDEEDEYKQQTGFRRAFESAMFACAISKDCRALVLKIALPEDEVSPDKSCENMDGAVCIGRDINPAEIVSIHISNDLSLVKGYFINLAHENKYSNLSFTRLEQKISEVFKKSEIYPEDIDDMIEWAEIPVLSLA